MSAFLDAIQGSGQALAQNLEARRQRTGAGAVLQDLLQNPQFQSLDPFQQLLQAQQAALQANVAPEQVSAPFAARAEAAAKAKPGIQPEAFALFRQGITNLGEQPTEADIANLVVLGEQLGLPAQVVKTSVQSYLETVQQNALERNAKASLDEMGIAQSPELLQIDPSQPQPANPPSVAADDQSHISASPAPEKPGVNNLSNSWDNLTDDKLGELSAHPNPVIANQAKARLQNRQFERKKFESDRALASKEASDFVKDVRQSKESVRARKSALQMMEIALDNGDVDAFSKAGLSQMARNVGLYTLAEKLQSPEGAVFQAGIKEFLLGNVSRAGARPNQWIEQQIAEMLAAIGRDEPVNRATIEALRYELSIEDKRNQLYDQISEQQKQSQGFISGDIDSAVDKQLQPFVDEANDQFGFRFKQIQESQLGEKELKKRLNKKVVQGTPLTPKMARVFVSQFGSPEVARKKAEALGYRILSSDEIKRFGGELNFGGN